MSRFMMMSSFSYHRIGPGLLSLKTIPTAVPNDTAYPEFKKTLIDTQHEPTNHHCNQLKYHILH